MHGRESHYKSTHTHTHKRKITSMNDLLAVEVGDTLTDSPDKLSSVMLIVTAFTTDPVKQLSSLRQLGHQVHFFFCMHQRKARP